MSSTTSGYDGVHEYTHFFLENDSSHTSFDRPVMHNISGNLKLYKAKGPAKAKQPKKTPPKPKALPQPKAVRRPRKTKGRERITVPKPVYVWKDGKIYARASLNAAVEVLGVQFGVRARRILRTEGSYRFRRGDVIWHQSADPPEIIARVFAKETAS